MKNKTIEQSSGISNSESQSVKAYQPPAIISRERLESAANVCTGAGLKTQPGAPAPGGGLCGQAGTHS